jgi:multicomponent Na+:H+ antiporter subunit F
MQQVFVYLTMILGVIIFIPLIRIVQGPTLYDRMLGAGAVATKTLALIIMIGYIFNRVDMFIDITLAYASLNFIGTIAIARYLESIVNKLQKRIKDEFH